jgi:imidazolonepropionase-like amidohydrolase
MRHVPQEIVTTQASNPPDAEGSAQWASALAAAQSYLGMLIARGVPITAGTDTPCAVPPGLGLWRELQLLAGAGLTPSRALRCATAGAAHMLIRPELGRLRPGAAADIAVIRGDPLAVLPDAPELVVVMKDGVVLAPAKLLAEAARVRDDLADEPWQQQFAWHAQQNRPSST